MSDRSWALLESPSAVSFSPKPIFTQLRSDLLTSEVWKVSNSSQGFSTQDDKTSGLMCDHFPPS